MNFRIAGFILTTGFLAACGSMQTAVPTANKQLQAEAAMEINAFPLPIEKTVLSAMEAEEMLHRVYGKLLPVAQEVCDHLGEQKTCWWDVDYAPERAFNAYATKENQIVVYHDVMTHVSSDDELAMVIAHEMGHHIAEHIDETKARAATGAILGALAAGAIAYNAGPCYNCSQQYADLGRNMTMAGAAIGQLSFSVKQEKEADALSAFILHRAGYDLLESRNTVVKLGAMGGRDKTGLFSTHPAGPERLATYDLILEIVANDPDGLPDTKADRKAAKEASEQSKKTVDVAENAGQALPAVKSSFGEVSPQASDNDESSQAIQ